MIELAAIGGIAVLSAAFGVYVGATSEESGEDSSDGCGGHHWGEKEPVVRPHALVENSTRQYGEFNISQHWHTVKLTVNAHQTCEDCGEIRRTEMEIGTKKLTEFVPDES